MDGSHILALDQGTTSSRAMLFDLSGRTVGVEQEEFSQLFPHPGWVEHDPLAIWDSQLATARRVIERAGISATEIACIGIANQRETVVVWDRATGQPIHNAIVWQDRRTVEYTDRLRGAVADALIRKHTGLLPDPYFSASKVQWVLDHVEGARDRAEHGELALGTIDSWLIYKLTDGAEHVTDVSNASRTMLFDIRSCEWHEELLDLFSIPRSMLPKVVDSSGELARTDARVFGSSIPISGVAGDQQAALFGQRCTERGMVKNTYGTGCFLLVCTGDTPVESNADLLTTIAWRRAGQPPQYALEGSVFIGGAVVQWLRDGLGIIESAPEVNALAESVGDNGGVVVVPAFSGLGAPHWDPAARGLMIGITRGTTSAHIARAALESIALQVADLLDAMGRDMGGPPEVVRVDGGAAVSDLLMQMQADYAGVEIQRPRVTETTARGAAMLAGLGVGVWQDPAELSEWWQEDRAFSPQLASAECQKQRAMWNRAVERSKRWAVE